MKTKLLLLIPLLALLIACEKKDTKPAYVGTWESAVETDTLTTDPYLVLLNHKMELTLEENTWQMIMKIKVAPIINDFTDYMGFKGTMTVDGEDAVVNFTEVGIRSVDTQTFTFIDDAIVWYNAEDNPTNFSALMAEYGPDNTTIQAKLNVSGNTLTMKSDDNLNGTYEEDEITEFTRIK